MLTRVLEPEVMDSAEEAIDYDQMDHTHVNQMFVADLLHLNNKFQTVLDVGTGTAQIPIALCQRQPTVHVVAIDMAEQMLRVGQTNVERAGLSERIHLRLCDAKRMPFAAGNVDAAMSNSIVHHIPTPFAVLAEMIRVVKPGGLLFVRDLLRPVDETSLRQLVQTYAGDANAHQQKMFGDSLHAALTLDEVRGLVARLGFDPITVQPTSDRHWTWATTV
ncbi:MAG: methyltransferase domain-containing protein [Gemmataceae bacterium]|nr:methyltransferase domain-containing protein [Gemmataceae bacterium]